MTDRPLDERSACALIEQMVTAVLAGDARAQAEVCEELSPGEELLARAASSTIAAFFEALSRSNRAANGPDAARMWQMQLAHRDRARGEARHPTGEYVAERVGRSVRVVTAASDYNGLLESVDQDGDLLVRHRLGQQARIPMADVRELWVDG